MMFLAALEIPFMDQPNPTLSWVLAGLAVLILGIAKSGFGGGVGIVAVPMFALAMGAKDGAAALLPLLIAADVFSVYHHWGTWDTHILKVLAPGTLTGIAIGSIVLWVLVVAIPRSAPPARSETQSANSATTSLSAAHQAKAAKKSGDNALNLLTGIVSVGYVVLDQVRRKFAPRWHFKPNHKSGFVAGTAVGVVSTISHAAGPIAAIFLLGQGLARQVFIGTTVIYFFGINTVKLIPYSCIPNLMTWDTLWIGLWLLPLVPVGTFLGAWLNRRMSESVFQLAIMLTVLLTGLQLIVESVSSVSLVGMLKVAVGAGG